MPISNDKGLHLYIMQSDVTGAVKVGRSSNPAQRRRELQTGCPYRIKILTVLEGKGSEEHKIHKRLEKWRIRGGTEDIKGEWYRPDCLPCLPDWVYETLPLDDLIEP